MSPFFVPSGDLDVPEGFSKNGDTLVLRSDLAHQTSNKPLSDASNRVKQEIADAEEELGKLNGKKDAKSKAALKMTIRTKNQWLKEVNDEQNKHFTSQLNAMLHGYQLDLTLHHKEHVRTQGLVVEDASGEFSKLLEKVIPLDLKIESKIYSSAELRQYKSILHRFSESIKALIIEDKSQITLKKIKAVLEGNDLTIEHDCIGHAIYSTFIKQKIN